MSTLSFSNVFNVINKFSDNEILYNKVKNCKNPYTFEIIIDGINLPLSFITNNRYNGFATQSEAENYRSELNRSYNLNNKIFILMKKYKIVKIYSSLSRLIYLHSDQYPIQELEKDHLVYDEIKPIYSLTKCNELNGSMDWGRCGYHIEIWEVIKA